VLEEWEVVQALGICRWKHAEADEWSDDFGKLLLIDGTDKIPVFLSDEGS